MLGMAGHASRTNRGYEIRDALVDAAPDLIQVALAAQWYIECLEAVLERRPVRGLDEAQHGYEAAIAPLLESEAE